MKFGLFSDLHLDIMHDGEARLKAFIDASRKADVDFVIHCGDFCYPNDTSFCRCNPARLPVNLKNAMEIPTDVDKDRLLDMYRSFEKPHYFVMGNHEFDFCSKEETVRYYGMESPYYSFTSNGWDFIVLDGNFFKDQKGVIRDYCYGDYFESDDLPYISDEQISWLDETVKKAERPVAVFSHQPIYGNPRAIKNGRLIQDIFKKYDGKVKLCVSGHLHVDRLYRSEGVAYYYINSISNYWAGIPWAEKRYSDEIERKYPNLQYTYPYKEPVFCIVTLDEKGAKIEGCPGSFVQPGPGKMHYPLHLTSTVKSRYIKFE